MKRILSVLIIVSIVLVGFVHEGFAMAKRPASKKAAAQVKKASEVAKITGKVSGYNWSNSTLTVSVSGGTSVTITADKNTIIKKDGKVIKLTDIKTGDVVMIMYEAKRGINVAKSISVETRSISTTGSQTKKR